MTTVTTIGPYTAGEKAEPLVYTFLDAAGSAIDITGYDAKVTIGPLGDDAEERDADLSTDGSDGAVEYEWDPEDLATAGYWDIQFWAGNGTQLFASPIFRYRVAAAVGTAPAI